MGSSGTIVKLFPEVMWIHGWSKVTDTVMMCHMRCASAMGTATATALKSESELPGRSCSAAPTGTPPNPSQLQPLGSGGGVGAKRTSAVSGIDALLAAGNRPAGEMRFI